MSLVLMTQKRSARRYDREKLRFKWCSLEGLELTIGAKERRCFLFRTSQTSLMRALWRSGDAKTLHNSR